MGWVYIAKAKNDLIFVSFFKNNNGDKFISVNLFCINFTIVCFWWVFISENLQCTFNMYHVYCNSCFISINFSIFYFPFLIKNICYILIHSLKRFLVDLLDLNYCRDKTIIIRLSHFRIFEIESQGSKTAVIVIPLYISCNYCLPFSDFYLYIGVILVWCRKIILKETDFYCLNFNKSSKQYYHEVKTENKIQATARWIRRISNN